MCLCVNVCAFYMFDDLFQWDDAESGEAMFCRSKQFFFFFFEEKQMLNVLILQISL